MNSSHLGDNAVRGNVDDERQGGHAVQVAGGHANGDRADEWQAARDVGTQGSSRASCAGVKAPAVFRITDVQREAGFAAMVLATTGQFWRSRERLSSGRPWRYQPAWRLPGKRSVRPAVSASSGTIVGGVRYCSACVLLPSKSRSVVARRPCLLWGAGLGPWLCVAAFRSVCLCQSRRMMWLSQPDTRIIACAAGAISWNYAVREGSAHCAICRKT